MKILKAFLAIIFVLSVGVVAAHEEHKDTVLEDESIVVFNAWVRMMPSSQKITAAYMVIENNLDHEIILESATSANAEVVEIHQMTTENGQMVMNMVNALSIPAKGEVVLSEGGYHLMLINLKKATKVDDLIPITLHIKGQDDVMINAKVSDKMPFNEKFCSCCSMPKKSK